MIQKITKQDVQNLIIKNLNLSISLKQNQYYWKITSSNHNSLITWSPNDLKEQNSSIVSFGLPIIELVLSKFQLIPPLINLLSDISIIQLSWEAVNRLSKGESISSQFAIGHYIVKDPLNRAVAFVVSKNNSIFPIVDIGYYLRGESMKANT